MKIRHILEACVLSMIISQIQLGWAQEKKSDKQITVGVPSAQERNSSQQAPRTGSTTTRTINVGGQPQAGGTVERSPGVIQVQQVGGGKIQTADPFAKTKGGTGGPLQPPQAAPMLSPAAIERSQSQPGVIPVPAGGLPQIPFIVIDPSTLPPSPFPSPGSPGADPGSPGP